jgi:hypothetical protein
VVVEPLGARSVARACAWAGRLPQVGSAPQGLGQRRGVVEQRAGQGAELVVEQLARGLRVGRVVGPEQQHRAVDVQEVEHHRRVVGHQRRHLAQQRVEVGARGHEGHARHQRRQLGDLRAFHRVQVDHQQVAALGGGLRQLVQPGLQHPFGAAVAEGRCVQDHALAARQRGLARS